MLKHGILGLLSYGDMTGYEIKEAFESSLSFFWPAQTSQIYRELGVLEKNLWIVRSTVEQRGKPNKNVCSITDAGRRELVRWLSDPVGADMRSPTLMKVFFMGALPIPEALELFRRMGEEYRAGAEALGVTGDVISSYRERIEDKESALFWQMTADFGSRYTQMYLEWIESCMNILKNTEDGR